MLNVCKVQRIMAVIISYSCFVSMLALQLFFLVRVASQYPGEEVDGLIYPPVYLAALKTNTSSALGVMLLHFLFPVCVHGC